MASPLHCAQRGEHMASMEPQKHLMQRAGGSPLTASTAPMPAARRARPWIPCSRPAKLPSFPSVAPAAPQHPAPAASSAPSRASTMHQLCRLLCMASLSLYWVWQECGKLGGLGHFQRRRHSAASVSSIRLSTSSQRAADSSRLTRALKSRRSCACAQRDLSTLAKEERERPKVSRRILSEQQLCSSSSAMCPQRDGSGLSPCRQTIAPV
jgi:hypothetical protein